MITLTFSSFLFFFAFLKGDQLLCIYSQRKRPLLIVNNYLYRKNRDNYWRCVRCTSQKCRASLILNSYSNVTLCILEHSHPAETDKINKSAKVYLQDAESLPNSKIIKTE